jgi:hypothetical protein
MLALITGLSFLYFFPQLKIGPYGAVDPTIVKLIVDNEAESGPLTRLGWRECLTILWPIMAFIMSGFFSLQTKNPGHRAVWALNALLLGPFILLAIFYQCRFQAYAATFSVIPLAYAIGREWESLGNRHAAVRGHGIRLAILSLIGPLTLLLSMHATKATVLQKNNAPEASAERTCDMHALADWLNDIRHYGDRPRIIINSFNEGPEILFRTPHQVLAGPYHTNIKGNIDTLNFFKTHDPLEAKSIAHRHGAELVVFCNLHDQITAYLPDKNAIGDKPNFIQQLGDGKFPGWLKPVKTPSFGNLMLFEIHE